MKNSINQYLYSVLRQAFQECKVVGNYFFKILQRTPLPKIALVGIALAVFITLIPLALTLFVLFVLIKLGMLIIVMNTRVKVRKNRANDVDIIYPNKRIDQ